jgi:heme-binding HmuY-like protein
MTSRILLGLCVAATACGSDSPDPQPTPDAPAGCVPATVLPNNYRPIAEVTTGAVSVTTTGGVTSGTIDATAGGLSGSADNPYVYVDLVAGTRVDIDDVAALTSDAWDIALKRSSLRVNSGDSGPGGRELAVVQGASLDVVTAAPTSGYATDDFADADCELQTIPGGEPLSAFGEWYDYDPATHVVTPKEEVYVVKRSDGATLAIRFATYYGDTAMPMRGAFYQTEWKIVSP